MKYLLKALAPLSDGYGTITGLCQPETCKRIEGRLRHSILEQMSLCVSKASLSTLLQSWLLTGM